MALELTRVDYGLVGITSPSCMKLLPLTTGTRGTQRVIIGGNDGILHMFSMKKGEMSYTFKSLPGEKIAVVKLGGTIGTPQDKIFIASKNEIRGYTKKGKQFLCFDTNLTEPITSIAVCGSDLLAAGTHVYNHYRDCKDANSYLSSDKIIDLVALSVEKTQRLTAVLACEDGALKVVERSNLISVLPLKSQATCLGLLNNDGGDTGDNVVYAMQNGQIGLVQISRSGIKWKWVIDNEKNRESVLCMDWYDITRDGIKELIVGREDGSIQIYAQPFEPTSDADTLIERFNFVCNESITSIQGGNVGNANFDEIVATTYTGWFFGLTTEILEKQVGREGNNNKTLTLMYSNDDKVKLEHLRSEIEDLEQKVSREREKYQLSTQEDSIGISTIPPLNIKDKVILLKDQAVLQLSIETETAIDNVLLQSDVFVKLLDVEKNSAVVSHSPCTGGNRLLATYRCQVNTTKLNVLFQTGPESGTLTAYITPHAQPKAAHMRTYPLRPLSLLYRTHEKHQDLRYHILTLKGSFSLAEIHNWLSKCLPDLPDKLPNQQKISYNYLQSLIETFLTCTYSKGEAEIVSNDITTISIVKDVLTKEATKKKIILSINFEICDEAMKGVISYIYPKLEKEFELAKSAELYEAIKDIEVNDTEPTLQLTEECRNVIKKCHLMKNDINVPNNFLHKLQATIMVMANDWFKIKEINGKAKLEYLQQILSNCTLNEILEILNLNVDDK